jgi:hypothetical protein
MFFDFGCTGFAPEVFLFLVSARAAKIHSPAEFVLANTQPSRVVSPPIGRALSVAFIAARVPALRRLLLSSLPAAETFSGLTCLIQQAKNLFHSQRLEIYQEVLAREFRRKFGMAPADVWENLNPLAGIQRGVAD